MYRNCVQISTSSKYIISYILTIRLPLQNSKKITTRIYPNNVHVMFKWKVRIRQSVIFLNIKNDYCYLNKNHADIQMESDNKITSLNSLLLLRGLLKIELDVTEKEKVTWYSVITPKIITRFTHSLQNKRTNL